MTGELSLTVLSPPPLLRSALTGKTEHRFPENGPSYTVEGPWESWNVSEAARKEAWAWLKAIGDFEKPLDRGACDVAIVELGNAVSMPKMSKDEAKGRLRVYHAALADLPASVVLGGLREAIKTCKWFPSVAELRRLMEPEAKELRLQVERARTLAVKHKPTPKLSAQILKGYGTLTEAQRVEHEQRMAKLRIKLGFDTGKARGLKPHYVPLPDEEREETLRKLEGR